MRKSKKADPTEETAMDRMPSSYYRERAAESAREAASAKLDQVRQRHLRSEAAWLEMAAQQDETDSFKFDAGGDDDDEDEPVVDTTAT